MASRELIHEVALSPDRPVQLEVRSSPGTRLARGVKLGLRRAAPGDDIERAVAAAAASDATIVIVGTDHHWEGEGGDRSSMGLPGRQDELVRRVLAVAPDAVIVCNTGAPVAMPWPADARCVVADLVRWPRYGRRVGRRALRRRGTRWSATDHLPDRARGQSVVRQLPRRGGTGALRRRAARGLPVLRHATRPGGVRVRPRAVVHARRIRRAAGVGHDVREGERLQVTVPVSNVGTRSGKEVVQLTSRRSTRRCAGPTRSCGRSPRCISAGGRDATWCSRSTSARSLVGPTPSPGSPTNWRASVPRCRGCPFRSRPTPRGWYLDPGRYELRIGRSSADIAHVVRDRRAGRWAARGARYRWSSWPRGK